MVCSSFMLLVGLIFLFLYVYGSKRNFKFGGFEVVFLIFGIALVGSPIASVVMSFLRWMATLP